MAGGVRNRPLVASFGLFALALVLPLATVAVIATHWYVGSERERLRTTVTLIGEEIRTAIDHDLSEMEAVARTLATSPSIDAGDLNAFRVQAAASVDTANLTVTLTELDGRQLVNTRARSDETLPTVPRPELTARLLETRRPMVSGLLISGLTGRRIIGVSAPVIRGGMVVKVVAVVVRVEHFEQLIRRPHITGPYWAAVIDRDGNLVARIGDEAGMPGGQGNPADAVADLSGASGFLHVTENSRRSDWRFVAGVERDALEAPLRHSLVLLLGLALLLIGPGGLLAVLLAHRIARAAAGLAAKAEAIGRGETVRPEDSPIREVQVVGGALAEASRILAEQRAALASAQAGLEAQVEASQTRSRMLAETISDVVVLRHQGSTRGAAYVSPSFERMLGYDEGTRAGLTAANFIHPDDLAAVLGIDAALAAGQRPVTALFRARHRDGRWLWLECVSDRIDAAGPGEPDVIAVMRDVTGQKQQADELRIACDVAELAKAKAENASRAKSEFLAVMSHEIRTPLATIRGYTELLAGTGPLSAEQDRYLALVCEATGTMLTAIDDILDFARIESGDFRLEEESFALAGTVESVAAFVRPIAAAKGVTLGLTIDPNLPGIVRGDPRRLRQILLNLLHAGLRDRRGGLLTLSLYALRGAETRISFALTGSGGHAPEGGEDGLGLSIARRLVGRMGGRLETVSFAGEAASHRFSLPLPAAEAAALLPARPASAPPPEAAGPAGALLLLVEDHPINQEMTRRILERQGYRIDVVDDGAAAIAAVQARLYDLVLMDVQMPGMDGIAATRRIRALPHPCRHVPIVALTADVMPERVRAIFEAGMNAHLAKPIDRDRLCEAIAGALSSVMLAEARPPEPGQPAAPLAIDRRAFDGLAASLGPDGARGALRGFLALLDATFAAPAALRAEASTLAAGARRFGLTDLAAALDALAGGTEAASADAALRRAQVARDLVNRSLDELIGVGPVEISGLIAHL